MTYRTLFEIPENWVCRLCGRAKPRREMIVVRQRATADFKTCPRCKQCHNARERGHRRIYKAAYMRRWRARNGELDKSYWRKRDKRAAAEAARRYYRRFRVPILVRLRLRRVGMPTLQEAAALARRFNALYPRAAGLTPAGRRECERMRSRMRTSGLRPNMLEIRMMVYEDGFFKNRRGRPRITEVPA